MCVHSHFGMHGIWKGFLVDVDLSSIIAFVGLKFSYFVLVSSLTDVSPLRLRHLHDPWWWYCSVKVAVAILLGLWWIWAGKLNLRTNTSWRACFQFVRPSGSIIWIPLKNKQNRSYRWFLPHTNVWADLVLYVNFSSLLEYCRARTCSGSGKMFPGIHVWDFTDFIAGSVPCGLDSLP